MSLSLYAVQDDLEALLNTVDLVDDLDERLAILEEIAKTNNAAIAKRDGVARFVKMLEYRLSSVDEEIERLKDLRTKWTNEKNRFENYVVDVIQKFAPEPKRGPKKLEGNTSVLSLAKNPPSVDITQASAIPLEYKNVTITMSGSKYGLLLDRLKAAGLLEEGVLLAANASSVPSKALLKDAIHDGVEIDGASIREGGVRLVVK